MRVEFGLLAGGHPDNVDEIAGLESEGTLAYKSFTCNAHSVPALQSADMLRLYKEIERVGCVSMVHPEDELLVKANREQIEAEGRTDGRVVPEWRSKLAEQVSIATTLRIAEAMGVRLRFAHLSHPAVVHQTTRAKNVASTSTPKPALNIFA